MNFFLLSLMMTSFAFASIDKAPANFTTKYGKAIFVDFLTAKYKITFDVLKEKTLVESEITFQIDKEGMPIFDLVAQDVLLKFEGQAISVKTISDPDSATTYRLMTKVLSPGTYTINLIHSFETNTSYSSNSVLSGFWISDLNDRRYLEQYLPTNLEYDQYKMYFSVSVVGTDNKHTIYTNGHIHSSKGNSFEIEFPEYFTSSSLYFHLTTSGRFDEKQFSFTSKNGAIIPITVYAKWSWSLSGIEEKITVILNELEEKFGYWGHPSLTVYIAGSGGMEHSGATITSLSALGHELTHSYFARGVMPADGNSGWLDEAIASWRDDGYRSVTSPNFSSTKMSGHSQYSRTTDRQAYTQGANFMAYLNFQLQSLGGLRAFLESLYSLYNHQSISTHLFKLELELFSSKDFGAQFNQYIYGQNFKNTIEKSLGVHNPNHPILTKQQLMELL